MNRKQIPDEGSLLWWDSGKAPRDGVKIAFKSVGYDSLVPLFDPIACLKVVADDLVTSAGMKIRGQPIEYRQLRRDVIGVVAVREIKGDKRNAYLPLFSLGCQGTDINNFKVSFFDVDTAQAPEIAQNLQSLEQAASALWDEHKEWLPAKDLTEAVRNLVFRLKGTMLKDSGGLYFLPEEHCAVFEQLATDIEATDTEARFTLGSFPLNANPRLFKRLFEGLEAEVLFETSKMQDEVADLAGNSKKMRRNGIERRMKDICAWTDKVEYYEQMMGVAMPKLKQAIEDAKYAIGVHGLASMGAST